MTKYEITETGKYYYRRRGWLKDYKVEVVYNTYHEELEMWIAGEDEGILFSDIPSDAIFEEI